MSVDEATIEIIKNAKTIAVVGLSPKNYRPSNSVARYLMEQGYAVVPIVDIFRAPRNVLPQVAESIEIGAALVWMQVGVTHEEAALKARQADITVVMDLCLSVEHRALKRQRLL